MIWIFQALIGHWTMQFAPIGHAEIILAAFHHFAPQLIGRLPGAWRRVGAWRRHELPHRAPPMPPAVVRGLAGLAVVQGRADVALALLISFHGMLRGAEICALRLRDIMHCGDSAVLNLGLTKGGVRKGVSEQVTITDATLARWLQKFAAKRNCQSMLLNLSSSSYRLYFKRLLCFFDLDERGYTLHSLRRGGATHFFRRTANMGATVERGRWTSVSTARLYITEGLAVMAHHSLALVVSDLLSVATQALWSEAV